ncbi:MAG: hypothetical protein ABSD45_17545 [Terriglobia bacterium]|jgi:hypothetical protein
MTKRLPAILGYAVAVLTIAVAVVGPLFWFGVFSRAAAKTSLRIDPEYTGGEPARIIARDGYQIVVYKPVLKRAPLSPTASFVQIVWKPVSALPAAISEPIDLDGDGRPDCVVSFQASRDPHAKLRVTVKPLTALVQPMNEVGKDSFSSLIARVNDAIVVRVPLRN